MTTTPHTPRSEAWDELEKRGMGRCWECDHTPADGFVLRQVPAPGGYATPLDAVRAWWHRAKRAEDIEYQTTGAIQ